MHAPAPYPKKAPVGASKQKAYPLLGGALVGGTESQHFDPRHGRPRDHPAVSHHQADEDPMPGSLVADRWAAVTFSTHIHSFIIHSPLIHQQ